MDGNHLYSPRFYEFLDKAKVDTSVLPAPLQTLIEKYENALGVLHQETTGEQSEWLEVLVKMDAVICAKIYHLYKNRLEVVQMDKVKLMALRAKALQLKWKLAKV